MTVPRQPAKAWLDEIEFMGAREERLLDEIEAALKPFGGDVLDNGPKGSMRYLSDHLKDLVVRWAGGAMQHEREACEQVCAELRASFNNDGPMHSAFNVAAAAIRARGER